MANCNKDKGMMKMPKISIILPVYNGEKYIKDTIKSLLNQTFKDFELIIVDDGSSDRSAEICENFARLDDRIIVIHQKNGGVSNARNKGIDLARGEYVSFVDSDDSMEIDMYERLYNNIIESNADISSCNILLHRLDGKVDSYHDGEKKCYEAKELISDFFSNAACKAAFWGPYNKLIKTDIVKNVKFNPKYRIGEDILFVFECIENSKKIVFENVGLYHYIKREASATTASFSDKRFDYIYVVDELVDKVKTNYDFTLDVVLDWSFLNKLAMCRSLNANKRIKQANKEFYKDCLNFVKQYKRNIWNRLTWKRKIDYYVVRYLSFLCFILEKL